MANHEYCDYCSNTGWVEYCDAEGNIARETKRCSQCGPYANGAAVRAHLTSARQSIAFAIEALEVHFKSVEEQRKKKS